MRYRKRSWRRCERGPDPVGKVGRNHAVDRIPLGGHGAAFGVRDQLRHVCKAVVIAFRQSVGSELVGADEPAMDEEPADEPAAMEEDPAAEEPATMDEEPAAEAHFTTVSTPVMTRLRMDERDVLDTLIDAGVARSRSEALAWCVRLVGHHEADWIDHLRDAVATIEEARARGPMQGEA